MKLYRLAIVLAPSLACASAPPPPAAPPVQAVEQTPPEKMTPPPSDQDIVYVSKDAPTLRRGEPPPETPMRADDPKSAKRIKP